MRQDLLGLLTKIVGNQPLSPDLQRRAFDLFAAVMELPASGAGAEVSSAQKSFAATTAPPAAAPAAATRRLVYVHGICKHSAGFSDTWWAALQTFVPSLFGNGTLGQTRLEVIWSDIVNQASAMLGSAIAGAQPATAIAAEAARNTAAEEIKEQLRDRVDQQQMNAAVQAVGHTTGAATPAMTSGAISIPGLNCIDDFSIYLTSDSVRQQILNRFIQVVRPLLQAGNQIDIISHSWGTVVAYEGLRQLEDEGLASPLVHCLFTVGAALSIGPVKSRLRDANKNGRKPANVARWINLDARGDIVGGPLQGRPYQVDADFVNLEPTGCGSFLGLVNPQCAHGSYFNSGNVVVNRDIFAANLLR